jgi:hypothetical protein
MPGSLRGRLLLLALAVTCGCGARVQVERETSIDGGAPSAAAGAGGSVPSDAASESDAGAGPNPVPAGTLIRGPGGSHAGCPELQPTEFGSCTLPGDGLCKYRYSATCRDLTIARCVSDHTWRVMPARQCGGPPGPTCPEWPPLNGAPCARPADDASHDCYYPLRCEVISTCYGHWQSTNVFECADAGE